MAQGTTTKAERPEIVERPLLLTEEEAARLLKVSPRSLQKWRVQGKEPPFVKLGSRVLYRPEDLRRCIDARLRRSTSDPGSSTEDSSEPSS